jgi:hypothetical protein
MPRNPYEKLPPGEMKAAKLQLDDPRVIEQQRLQAEMDAREIINDLHAKVPDPRYRLRFADGSSPPNWQERQERLQLYEAVLQLRGPEFSRRAMPIINRIMAETRQMQMAEARAMNTPDAKRLDGYDLWQPISDLRLKVIQKAASAKNSQSRLQYENVAKKLEEALEQTQFGQMYFRRFRELRDKYDHLEHISQNLAP